MYRYSHPPYPPPYSSWLPEHINFTPLKNNPQNSVSVPHMPMDMGSSTGAWQAYQDHLTKEKSQFLHQYPLTTNS